jgi:hypothetical protein
MKTLFEEQPGWVSTRLSNRLVHSAVNWAVGPDAWRQAAYEAFNQLKPIQSVFLRHSDTFQNQTVPDQRDPRFISYLDEKDDH